MRRVAQGPQVFRGEAAEDLSYMLLQSWPQSIKLQTARLRSLCSVREWSSPPSQASSSERRRIANATKAPPKQAWLEVLSEAY